LVARGKAIPVGESTIMVLAVLGLVAPLLPRWRPLLLAAAVFLIGDGVLLALVNTQLAAEPNPGPGQRMAVLLAYAPTAAFILSCIVRLLFELARAALRRRSPGTPASAVGSVRPSASIDRPNGSGRA
jgi:hypothetical protein